jgi:hypothetical protein
LDLTEKRLEQLIKDKSFLQAAAAGINFTIWCQKTGEKRWQNLLDKMKIPSHSSIDSIYQSLYNIERSEDLNSDRIKKLEAEIAFLRAQLQGKQAETVEIPAKGSRREKKIENVISI